MGQIFVAVLEYLNFMYQLLMIKVCDSMGSEYRKSGHLRNTIQWIMFLAFTFLNTDRKKVKKPLRFRKI